MVIPESHVGSDPNELNYPGIGSCMTITLLLDDGTLLGTHLTVGATPEELKTIMDKLHELKGNRKVEQIALAGRELTWEKKNKPKGGKDYHWGQLARTVAKQFGVSKDKVETHNTVPDDQGFHRVVTPDGQVIKAANRNPEDAKTRTANVKVKDGQLHVDVGLDGEFEQQKIPPKEGESLVRVSTKFGGGILVTDKSSTPEAKTKIVRKGGSSPETATPKRETEEDDGALISIQKDEPDHAAQSSGGNNSAPHHGAKNGNFLERLLGSCFRRAGSRTAKEHGGGKRHGSSEHHKSNRHRSHHK